MVCTSEGIQESVTTSKAAHLLTPLSRWHREQKVPIVTKGAEETLWIKAKTFDLPTWVGEAEASD